MTDLSPILAAIDGAEVLSRDGSPVTDVAVIVRGDLDRPNPFVTESRDEGGEAEATEGPAEARDLGYSVEAMNRRHALVLIGSKSVVMDENPGAPIEERHTFRTVEAFGHWYANRMTEVVGSDGKIKTKSWAGRWMQDRKRRQFSGVCFFPNPDGATAPEGYYNLWQGFSVEPRKGKSYATFADHLRENVCGGDRSLYAWVFGFFAHMVQRPRERLGVALVMRGKMGSGKTLPVEVFGSLIAAHFFLVDDPRYVTGNFNAHMASCILLGAEEAVWAGDKAAEGRLKGLVTSRFQMIENKGVDPIRLDNYVRLVMTSNEGWVVPAGKDERRFCVLDVSDRCAQNHEYFGEMMEELDDGGREALLWDLLHYDLSSVNLRVIPKTAALLEQKIRSLTSVESWWFERLRAGVTREKAVDWETEVECSQLFDDYVAKADRIGIKRRAAEAEVGMELKKLVPVISVHRIYSTASTGPARPRVYRLPGLDDCRALFEEAVGQRVDWGDGDRGREGSEG
jgi:hypothetical protein